jgi:hypothetical protein
MNSAAFGPGMQRGIERRVETYIHKPKQGVASVAAVSLGAFLVASRRDKKGI